MFTTVVVVFKKLQPSENRSEIIIIIIIIIKKFKKECKVVWKSELNAKNKVQAYNELVVVMLTSTFGVVKWTRQEKENASNQRAKDGEIRA